MAVNEDGLIFVAPDGFSESLLQESMRKQRVPIWLAANKTWYVNGSTGSDANDGSAPDKAFKTNQKAVNYISENFNLGIYTAFISIAPGTYDEDIILPKYSSSGGYMYLTGAGKAATIIAGSVYAQSACGIWYMDGLAVRYAGRSSPGTSAIWHFCLRAMPGADISVLNCDFDGGAGSTAQTRHVFETLGGAIRIADNCTIHGLGPKMETFIGSYRGGNVQILGDLQLNGEVSLAGVYASDTGSISMDSGHLGRVPVVSGSVTGNRAYAEFNGIINTLGSGGAVAFPGTAEILPTTGGQIA